ncbi:hypothetical protein STRCI_004492 [Streptomyces cinnabarinus]|uniref:Uncharacterized protein n=1 Tax=Streptomyces cinnabarinus TaxID=67287 RepID=A0ABY7KJ73_9ACTN|nr:hypothetical protein [Streptomyces cinnabarinus]WAZ23167.1 hypothetical protein STRCI_004492 [Streptomyces cinnabarinus]
MAVTISLALLFGIVLFMLLRSNTLGPGSAFVAVMFGFYLASTGAADSINQLMNAVVNAIPDL